MPRPYVIKPLSQGSSLGVQIIFPEDEFSFADYDFEYGEEILVEQYIKGRELQVAVLNGKAMGVLEIKILKGKQFYDYEAKYMAGFTEHLFPADVPESIYTAAMQISEQYCMIFECVTGIIRAEFIYNQQENKLYMLEINTHPGMTPLSICPEIVAKEGISYTELVNKIINNARFEQ
jgi:D-alanine-D-alanine ligase